MCKQKSVPQLWMTTVRRGARFHYFKWVLDAKTKFARLLHGVSPSCKCLGRTVARLADTADSRPLCLHIPPAGARVTGHRNINQSEGGNIISLELVTMAICRRHNQDVDCRWTVFGYVIIHLLVQHIKTFNLLLAVTKFNNGQGKVIRIIQFNYQHFCCLPGAIFKNLVSWYINVTYLT